MKLSRSITEDIRQYQNMDHRWHMDDDGLIWCWERGRQMAKEQPELLQRAKEGELMVLGWKGGFELKENRREKEKFGTYKYLAQWQGLREEDLSIDTDSVVVIRCPVSDVQVTFTNEPFYLDSEEDEEDGLSLD
jgi:hypothetical protein